MRRHSTWLVVYDIRDEHRLRKIEKIVGSYGKRIQKSVFEVDGSEKIIDALINECKDVVKDEDYLLSFPLCEMDRQKREFYGIYKKSDYNKDSGPYIIL